MRLFINVAFLLFITTTVFAQKDSLNSKRVDQKTLHHYYQKEWKRLISLGTEALRQDIDFKYLRYRMGIAQYELGHYNKAIPHFRKVEQETMSDTLLQEYQYYSYLFAGRERDARISVEKMTPKLRQKVGYQKFRLLNDISFDVGAKFSALSDSVGHMPILSLGMSHQIGSRLKYTHHFTYLTQNYLGLQYNQFEYYGKAEIALAKALYLVGAFHYTGLDGMTSNTFQDTTMPFEMTIESRTSQTGLVGLLGFGGNIGPLRWKAYGSVSNWRNTTIITPFPQTPFPPPTSPPRITQQSRSFAVQYGLELDYTLEVNKNIWYSFGGHFALQHQLGVATPVWGLRAYGQLAPKMGLGLNFMQANTTFFVANDAAFSSNTIGTLNAQVGATFNYQITPKLNWYMNYTYENRKTDNFDFDYHILFTGLKFRL